MPIFNQNKNVVVLEKVWSFQWGLVLCHSFFFFNSTSVKCSTYSKIFCFFYVDEDVDLWILMQNEVRILIYEF